MKIPTFKEAWKTYVGCKCPHCKRVITDPREKLHFKNTGLCFGCDDAREEASNERN